MRKLFLKKKEQEARWTEHFKETLNQPTPNMTYDFSNADSIALLDIERNMIVINEVWQAISALKNNKVTGIDQIPVELLKTGRDDLIMKLTRLLNMCWYIQCVPNDWQKGVIVKPPGDCNNWRCISRLSIPGKGFSIILLRCLQGAIDQMLWEE